MDLIPLPQGYKLSSEAPETGLLPLPEDWQPQEAQAPVPEASAGQMVQDAGLSLTKAVVAFPATFVGLADLTNRGATSRALKNIFGYDPKATREQLNAWQSEELQTLRKAAQSDPTISGSFMKTLTEPQVLGDLVTESGGSLLAGGVLGSLTRLSGLATLRTAPAIGEGLAGAGQAMLEATHEAPGMQPTGNQAAGAAISGAVTGLIGQGSRVLGQRLGVADIDTAVMTGRVGEAGQALKSRPVRTVVGAGLETPEEMGQSGAEAVIANIAAGRPWEQGVGTAMGMGGAAGLAQGGAVNVLNEGFGAANEIARERHQRVMEAEFDAMAKAAVRDAQLAVPGAINSPLSSPEFEGPVTPAMRMEAELIQSQIQQGLQTPDTPEGAAFAGAFNATLNLGERAPDGTMQPVFTAPNVEEASGDVAPISSFVQARREGEYQGLDTDYASQSIQAASDPRVIGLNLRQHQPGAGEVVAIGTADDKNFTPEYAQMLVQLGKTWLDRYMPGGRLVLNLNATDPALQAFGLYQSMTDPNTGEIVHVITPREYPGIVYQGGDEKTKVAIAYSFAHEFGHLLEQEAFWSGLGDLGKAIRPMLDTGHARLTDKAMAAIREQSPVHADLLAEWAEMRRRILANEMTIEEFVERWIGTRKLGFDVKKGYWGPDDQIGSQRQRAKYAWVREMLARRNMRPENAKVMDLVGLYGGVEALSFSEFMAEQFSRYAHDKKAFEGTMLGNFFARTMHRLREFFRMLKMHGLVKASTRFEDWMELQTASAKALPRRKRATIARKTQAARQKRAAELQAQKQAEREEDLATKEQPLAETPTPEEVELEAVADGTVAKVAAVPSPEMTLMTRLMDIMEASRGTESPLTEETKGVQMVKRLLFEGKIEEARGAINAMAKRRGIKFERESTTRLIEALPRKPTILAETLRQTLKRADIREKEKARAQALLEQYPDGIPHDVLVQELLKGRLKLEPKYVSINYDSWGLDRLKDTENFTGETIIWKHEGNLQTGAYLKHFFDEREPGYVAHSRHFSDMLGGINILEFQSDLFQDPAILAEVKQYENLIDPEQIVAQNQKTWYETALPELVEHFLAEGAPVVRFPLGSTAALVQNWPRGAVVKAPELSRIKPVGTEWDVELDPWIGQNHFDENTRQYVIRLKIKTKEGTAQSFLRLNLDRLGGEWRELSVWMGPEQITQIRNLLQSKESEFVRDRWAPSPVEVFPPFKGLFDLYETTIPGILHRRYPDAIKVSREGRDATLGKEDWLVIPNSTSGKGKATVLWERDSPYSSQIEGAQPADVAGLNQQASVDESARLWRERKFDSPIFRSWFGQSQITDPDTGKPLPVLRTLGMPVSQLPEGKAFWFMGDWETAQAFDSQAALAQSQAGVDPRPSVQAFYLRSENPLVVDMQNAMLSRDEMDNIALDAQRAGHDGVVLKNVDNGVGTTTQYAVFAPEQMALESDAKGLEAVDTLHWDRDSPTQAAGRSLVQRFGSVMQFINPLWAKAVHAAAKAQDVYLQLQQRATHAVNAKGELDWVMQHFVRLAMHGTQFKNMLQIHGNEVTKELLSVSMGRKNLAKFEAALRAEWESDRHFSELTPLDEDGEVVPLTSPWRITHWEHRDSMRLREHLMKHGIDPQTAQGARMLDLYLRYKNAMQFQFDQLHQVYREQIKDRYANNPLMQRVKLEDLRQEMFKVMAQPMFPQMRFGNNVLTVREWVPAKPGEKRGHWENVYVRHFESESEFNQAALKMRQQYEGKKGIDIKLTKLDDNHGIPLQMPRDLVKRLNETGAFSNQQLELMEHVLMDQKVEKIAKRYAEYASKIKGGEEDLVKNFAGFVWQNANYIWKVRYRREFKDALRAERGIIRGLGRDMSLDPVQAQAEIQHRQRNLEMMTKAMDYMLTPPAEMQTMRLAITMMYLAWNPITAILNLGTQINTWASLTTEYGAVGGSKHYTRAIADVMSLPWLSERISSASPTEQKRLGELQNVYTLAINQGIVDQSYAYFLAGQATSSDMMAGFKTTRVGQAAHTFTEVGMWPFRAAEKLNRLVTLVSMFEAERARGTEFMKAYEYAVQQVNLLQNAYDPANRPRFMRGVLAPFTIFMSFAQYMAWVSSGGYERAQHRIAREAGRMPKSWVGGPTMKIWLMYLLLGGLSGMPFGDDALEIFKFLWRKFFGTENVELELRKWLESIGADSNLVMHGALHDLGGFDLSGRFGVGRLLPGVQGLNKSYETIPEAAGNMFFDLSGAGGGFWKSVFESVETAGRAAAGDPVRATEIMSKLPGQVGSINRALDAAWLQQLKPQHGVISRQGEPMTRDLETGELRDLTAWELIGMGLGANPTILSQNREMNFAETGEKIYWGTRRNALLDNFARASVDMQDEDMVAKASKRIDEFNELIPHSSLRITGKDKAMRRSQRLEQVRLRNQGRDTKKLAPVIQEVQQAFGKEE